MSDKFEERILLRLHRQFSEDEAVGLAMAEYKKAKVEIGILRSTIHELEDEIANIKKHDSLSPTQIKQLKTKGWVKEILYDERLIDLEKQVKSLQERLRGTDITQKYKKEAKYWQEKYFSLLAKTQKDVH